MAVATCPICQSPIDPTNENVMPFCSERCKRIDLGRWLNEDYGLPADSTHEPPEEEDRFDS
jgi:hypothetical protein